jgi:two-component system sensor histidine kinase TtrS
VEPSNESSEGSADAESQRRELLALQEQVLLQQAELTHLARLNTFGGMAASLAHDLKQPLTAIINFCRGSIIRLRQMNSGPPDVIEAMQLAVETAARTVEMIQRFQAFIRKQEVSFQAVAVNELAADALDLVQPELRGRGVEVETRLADGLPAVRADAIQIVQVMVNLVLNAADASMGLPTGERTVTIETIREAGDVAVRILDRGCGIPPESLPKLFKPFFTTRPGGLGLGLRICKWIVESHGGRIWAESDTANGTTFMFTLPAL